MRFPLLAVLLVFLPSVARAQDEIIKDFSTTQVEKFIKEVIRAQIVKHTDPKNNIVWYDTPGGHFDIYVVGGPGKAILFRYPFKPDIKVPLERLNEWNARNAFTRGIIEKNGQMVLTAALDLQSGLSYGQFTNYYARIKQELDNFLKTNLPRK